MLMLTVPLRYMLRRRAVVLHNRGLVLGCGGLRRGGRRHRRGRRHPAVALDGRGPRRPGGDRDRRRALDLHRRIAARRCSALAGAITGKTIAFALLIGVVAFPGAFLAKAFVERLPLHVHTAILDAVVLFGGAVMVFGALTR